jgi:hypothetical protein
VNEDLYFSPLTDTTVLHVALQEAYNAGSGITGRPWHEAQTALRQRLLRVRNWWDGPSGERAALYDVELLGQDLGPVDRAR